MPLVSKLTDVGEMVTETVAAAGTAAAHPSTMPRVMLSRRGAGEKRSTLCLLSNLLSN